MKLFVVRVVSDIQVKVKFYFIKMIKLKWCSVFILLLIFNSCSVTKNNTVTNIELNEDQKFEFSYKFFEANRFQLNGNFDNAISIYSECLNIDPSSAVCYYNLAKIYLYKKDLNLAEQNISKAIQLNYSNEDYLYLAGSIFLNNNKVDQAETTFKELLNNDPSNYEYYISLADVYLQKSNLKKAISIYDQVDERFGISESISIQKNKIYLALNKKDLALNELVKLSNANENLAYYERLIAEFYLGTNDIEAAIIKYKEILKRFPNDGYNNIGLAECYQKQGRINEALGQIRFGFESDEVQSDDKISLFMSLWQSASNDENMRIILYDFVLVLVDKYPNNTDINIIYADYLLRTGKLEEAKEVLNKILKVKKDNYAIWEQLILVENQLLEWDSIYSKTADALEYFPNQHFFYFFKGFSAMQLEKFDEAQLNLEFGLKLTKSDDPMRNDYLSFLGEIYYRNKDKNKAYATFDKLLEIDSNNMMILNNYAYYLSEDNMDLEKAELMSKKTILAEPKNSTYLDTYGWILFKMSNFSEAQKYLEKAVIYDKNKSAVIVEHYGDVLFKLGDVDNAKKYWIIAKTYGEGSEFLEKKVETGIYSE